MIRISFAMLAILFVAAQAQAQIAKIDVVDWEVSSAWGGWGPENATNGNPATEWRTQGNGGSGGNDAAPYITFIFDDLYTINQITVRNSLDGDGGRGIREANVLYSTTGAPGTWIPLFDEPVKFTTGVYHDGSGWIPYDPQTIYLELDSSVVAKYIKLEILSTQYGYEFGVEGPESSVNRSIVNLNEVTFFGTPVPEPATMSLLALGGLALLRRRRKR